MAKKRKKTDSQSTAEAGAHSEPRQSIPAELTAAEREKYRECYRNPTYKLQGARRERVFREVEQFITGRRYLDVGCGRGELVHLAASNGLDAHGLELVPELCEGTRIIEGLVTSIPYAALSFHYVSCFDVLEHLPPEQVDTALDELFRVCGDTLIVTTNNKRSHYGDLELHLTRMPREWWDAKLVERAGGASILRDSYGRDEWLWRIGPGLGAKL